MTSWDITYALRSYYREQLAGCLLSIFAAEKLGDVFLSVPADATASPTETQRLLLDVLAHRGYYVHLLNGGTENSSNIALHGLIRGLYECGRTEYVLFVDDDVIFTREHVERLMRACGNQRRGVYYVMGETEGAINTQFLHASIGRRILEPYCSLVRLDDLLTIRKDAFEPLLRYSSFAEVAWFSGVFRLFDFELLPLRMVDRPYHLYIPEQKVWSAYEIEESYELISRASSAVTWAELEGACDKIQDLLDTEGELSNEKRKCN